MEVIGFKKYWHGIDALVYDFIVLEDRRDLLQPCPP